MKRARWYAIITPRGALFCRMDGKAELFRSVRRAEQVAKQYNRFGQRKLKVSKIEWSKTA